ncbi:MAG TPA: ROK family protein [Vicinamibacterales bacterium]|nr:ROK family protein [Vicinamibacterales bacterium]
MPLRIGIDLGGTKIEGIVLDGSREAARLRVDTPRGDYGATLGAIAGIVDALERQTATGATVGIGIPGTISPSTALVKNANSAWLIGRPLQTDLERRLERPVRVANDANCFAISEATDGAAEGADVVFGVIVGTGVGGGITVKGRSISGPNCIAGEWGHNPLPWPDGADEPRPCYCGKQGCIETFLSGPGFSADHEAVAGVRLNPAQIVEAAGRGDAAAEQTVRRYERRMARALASVINILDPDVIVLGGGMSNIDRLYTNVPRLWGRFVFAAEGNVESRLATRLVSARHGDTSGVRGAAWLWPDGPTEAPAR